MYVCACVSGEEIEQLEKMDHQLQALQGKHRHKKKQLKQVQEDLGVCECLYLHVFNAIIHVPHMITLHIHMYM